MGSEATVNETEWTIGRLLNWTTDYFVRREIADARLSGEILLAHAIDSRRIDLYTRFDQVPDPDAVARFRALIKRAAAREPVAYLVGEKEFFSLPFFVTPAVLIPRPETETLVEVVVHRCRQVGLDAPRLLDVGTGSGCITVSLLKTLPSATAVASDVSAAALNVAGKNAGRHGVADRIALVEADRLALPEEEIPSGGFDVIMSNPPYVSGDEMSGLDATVRNYEPHAALTDGQQGLSFYYGIAADAPRLLASGGAVVVEVADGKAQVVAETMCSKGAFEPAGAWKDRPGGPDRVLMFTCPAR